MRLPLAVATVLLVFGTVCEGDRASEPRDSIVRVSTPASSGTGVVLIPGFVVTDAHVVWPAEAVTVTLEDGEQHRADVVGFDRHLDLAILALPDDAAEELQPIAIASTATVGEPARHIGYRHDRDEVVRLIEVPGLLGVEQDAPEAGATFITTDASGVTGLSGGPLVNDRGQLLGITQFLVGSDLVFALDGQHALAAAERLIAAWDSDAPAALRLTSPGTTELVVTLRGPHAHDAYVVQSPVGPPAGGFTLELSGTSDGSVIVALLDVHGAVDARTQLEQAGPIQLSADVPGHEVRIMVLRATSTAGAQLSLRANTQLRRLDDEDHITAVTPGSPVRGVLDYPSDIDVYDVELPAGGVSLIRLTSVTFDPVLQIESIEDDESMLVATDDNSGGGLFGRDASIQFTAPRDGLYRVVVGDAAGGVGHAGGYVLSVSTPFVDR